MVSTLCLISLLNRVFDGVAKDVGCQISLFVNQHHLRRQMPLHLANNERDDASKRKIRNPEQTANEMIARYEKPLAATLQTVSFSSD